ncbi:hypothetical protein H8959_015391 [Pygathrix nigripes]
MGGASGTRASPRTWQELQLPLSAPPRFHGFFSRDPGSAAMSSADEVDGLGVARPHYGSVLDNERLTAEEMDERRLGGAPRSGIYGNSKARNKDHRDRREKRFPSSVLFIIPLLLLLKAPPFSTVAPLCILGHSIFSSACSRALSWEKRGVYRE